MSSSILITKLYFPQVRPTLVPRTRLVARLMAGLRGPLTLVAAPAGYGKTTLLSEWRAGPGARVPAVWLSLDAGDNDLPRFLMHLTAGFNALHPNLLHTTTLLLASSTLPPVDRISTTLINDLSTFEGELICVFDDYHVITNTDIHGFLEFLLEFLPPQLHLVILTRADPPMPLARLRARALLTEIRAADLRFNSEETAAFLNQIMGLNLTVEAITALEARTEGWIAGLQLAALSMQGHADTTGFIAAFSGGHQYIVDFLAEEVLHRQPPFIRDFLLKTAILDRLTGPLCDALTGREDGQAVLEMLAHANLFLIPLDDERRWFRYHHLFADLLRSRLTHAFPEQVPDLHRKASAWYDRHQMMFAATDHAFAAQDYDEVRRLMRSYFPGWWSAPNWGQVFKWFEKFPEDFLKAEPWLSVIYAWMVWGKGNLAETVTYLDSAQNACEVLAATGRFPVEDLEYEALSAEILGFRALIATQTSSPQVAIDLASRSLAMVPAKASITRTVALNALQVAYREKGDMDGTIAAGWEAIPVAKVGGQIGTIVTAYNLLGSAYVIQGQLQQAAAVFQDALAYAGRTGLITQPSFSLIMMRLADVYYLRNQLDQAEKLTREGLELAEFYCSLWPMIFGRCQLCMIYHAAGQHVEAAATWSEAEELLAQAAGAYYELELTYILYTVGAWLGLAAPPKLAGLAGKTQWTANPTVTQFERVLKQETIQVGLRSLDHRSEMLARLEKIAAARGHQFWQVEIHILQAVVWFLKGDQESAYDCLQKALKLAEPEKLIRVFVDRGEPVQKLLQAAAPRLEPPAIRRFAGSLLEAFGAAPPPEPKPPMPTPISAREREVLKLIANGSSNKEIAHQLVISLGTVKRHTVNIFNKLDVRNRTEAVARARELELL